MNGKPKLVLQFDPSEIDRLAERYGYKQDEEAFKAGRAVAGGNYSRENLKVIVAWKSARRIALIDENSDAEITRCLRFACDPRTSEKTAVETLTRLHGVGVPMASAILTTVNPERYTIIDYRALESLGVNKWTESVDYYLAYLETCRELAHRYGKPLRTLDRALWQWSMEHTKRDECP